MPIVALACGTTFDIRENLIGRSWDLLKEHDRREAHMIIKKEKPFTVIRESALHGPLSAKWEFEFFSNGSWAG